MDPDVIPLYKAVNECKIDSDGTHVEKKVQVSDGNDDLYVDHYNFGSKFIRMRLTDGVRELQTVIRDK